MSNPRWLAAACGLLVLGCSGAASAAGPARTVLVELFTSEGCSSCPPADAVLAGLLADQPVAGARILAFEEHVTYWDDLGWKDPFGSPQFTERQRLYAAVRGGSSVYTPQMVVDGRYAFVGSSRGDALHAVREQLSLPVAVALSQTSAESGGARLSATPQAALPEPAQLWLAQVQRNVDSQVARGENGGRQLHHAAVLRQLQLLGQLEPGSDAPLDVELPARGSGEWLAFVQGERSRQIYASAALR